MPDKTIRYGIHRFRIISHYTGLSAEHVDDGRGNLPSCLATQVPAANTRDELLINIGLYLADYDAEAVRA